MKHEAVTSLEPPDLGGLSISGREDIDPQPLSPNVLPPSRRPVQSGAPTSPSASAITLNINIHASTAALTVNTGTPGRELPIDMGIPDGSPLKQAPTRVVPSSEPSESKTPRVRYIIRGGGKARVSWVHSLEHIAPADPSHRKKWYVIIAGLRVGIWKSWLDMEEFVDVRGARYQSFGTRDEAEDVYLEARRTGRVRQLIK